MASLDGSIVAIAAPSLQHSLHASPAVLQLAISIYPLTFGALVVVGARLGSERGHRTLFMAGIVLFTVASALCGLAPDSPALIGGRAVQGIGGAMMVPQVLSVVQVYFEGAERVRAIGYYSFVLSLGVLSGQILGGLITSANIASLGWRPVFLINLPAGVAVTLAAARVIPAHPGSSERRPIDLLGTALLGCAMLAILFPLVLGRQEGWPAWAFVALAIGISGLGYFYRYERLLARRGRLPLVEFSVVRRAGVSPALGGAFTIQAIYSVVILVVTLHLQNALGYSVLRSGATFAFYAAGFACASLSLRRLPERVKRRLPVASLLTHGAAVVGIVFVARGGWSLVGLPVLVVAGITHAWGFSPLVAEATRRAGARYAAEVSGLLTVEMLISSVVSIALLGGLYFSAAAGRGGGSLLGLERVAAAIVVLCVVAALAALRALRAPEIDA